MLQRTHCEKNLHAPSTTRKAWGMEGQFVEEGMENARVLTKKWKSRNSNKHHQSRRLGFTLPTNIDQIEIEINQKHKEITNQPIKTRISQIEVTTEVTSIINKQKIRKAQGVDGINKRMVKYGRKYNM